LQSKTEVAEKILNYLAGTCRQMQPVGDNMLVT
jgi:hypothetical protein